MGPPTLICNKRGASMYSVHIQSAMPIAGWGFVRGFFGRSKFDMADWGYSFPVDVLAICLIQYSGDVRGSWTRGMAYTALTIATGLGKLSGGDSQYSLCRFCVS